MTPPAHKSEATLQQELLNDLGSVMAKSLAEAESVQWNKALDELATRIPRMPEVNTGSILILLGSLRKDAEGHRVEELVRE